MFVARRHNRSFVALQWNSYAQATLISSNMAWPRSRTEKFSLPCGRSVWLAEILGRFSSSSLAPSFAPGRRKAAFIAGTAP